VRCGQYHRPINRAVDRLRVKLREHSPELPERQKPDVLLTLGSWAMGERDRVRFDPVLAPSVLEERVEYAEEVPDRLRARSSR
jgi:hypothetical protein